MEAPLSVTYYHQTAARVKSHFKVFRCKA